MGEMTTKKSARQSLFGTAQNQKNCLKRKVTRTSRWKKIAVSNKADVNNS
jgi:hypothetical protein